MSKLPSNRTTKAYHIEMDRILNNAPKRQPLSDSAKPSRADDGDTRTQAQKFEDAAREHGADGDEDEFKGVLGKLAKPIRR